MFLDSSHVVSVGSDVVREYLEILPRLQPGVIVHVHDIFLPSDYPRDSVLSNFCFWSEQYLLQAFLTFNPHFEVLWASSAMQHYYPEVLLENFSAMGTQLSGDAQGSPPIPANNRSRPGVAFQFLDKAYPVAPILPARGAGCARLAYSHFGFHFAEAERAGMPFGQLGATQGYLAGAALITIELAV